MNVEKILSLLFDYQRFMQDDMLSSCINSTEERCLFQGVPLSDDMLEINAAGEPGISSKKDSNTDMHDPSNGFIP